MREEVGYLVKDVSDKAHKELTPDWVYHIFEDHYIHVKTIFTVDECHFKQEDGILAEATIHHAGSDRVINGMGNGRLDAVSNAIKHYFDIDYELAFYEEHSMTKGSSSKAVAYVGVVCNKKHKVIIINKTILRLMLLLTYFQLNFQSGCHRLFLYFRCRQLS